MSTFYFIFLTIVFSASKNIEPSGLNPLQVKSSQEDLNSSYDGWMLSNSPVQVENYYNPFDDSNSKPKKKCGPFHALIKI